MSGSLEISRDLTGGQIAAILNKVSGGDKERLEALLRDELEVQLVERILKLADKNGRIIPRGIKAAVCDANTTFHLVQPSLETVANYASRLVRFQEAFKLGTVMSAADFEGKRKELVAEIKQDKSLANLLNGVFLPIILLRLENFTDYGKTLEEVFLPAVKSSYEEEFPGRKFYNYQENELSDNISIVPGSRHDKVVAAMKQGAFVAIYFPNPFQGFSVLASREQVATLPESLILSGGFDTLAAAVMYPDILIRGFHTPGYDLSALTWRSPGSSLDLRSDAGRLVFDSRGSLGFADDVYSSSLLFLGSA